MSARRIVITVFSLVLGPAALWWGIVLLLSADPHGTPADIATGLLQGALALALMFVAFCATVLGSVLALQPVLKWIDGEIGG